MKGIYSLNCGPHYLKILLMWVTTLFPWSIHLYVSTLLWVSITLHCQWWPLFNLTQNCYHEKVYNDDISWHRVGLWYCLTKLWYTWSVTLPIRHDYMSLINKSVFGSCSEDPIVHIVERPLAIVFLLYIIFSLTMSCKLSAI